MKFFQAIRRGIGWDGRGLALVAAVMMLTVGCVDKKTNVAAEQERARQEQMQRQTAAEEARLKQLQEENARQERLKQEQEARKRALEEQGRKGDTVSEANQKMMFASYSLSYAQVLLRLAREMKAFSEVASRMASGQVTIAEVVASARNTKAELLKGREKLTQLAVPEGLPPEVRNQLSLSKHEVISGCSLAIESIEMFIELFKKNNPSPSQIQSFMNNYGEKMNQASAAIESANHHFQQAADLMSIPTNNLNPVGG
jgi:hypothetical protein